MEERNEELKFKYAPNGGRVIVTNTPLTEAEFKKIVEAYRRKAPLTNEEFMELEEVFIKKHWKLLKELALPDKMPDKYPDNVIP